MADKKETPAVPSINVFNDAQVVLMTQALAIVASILTEDRGTYKFAMKAFKAEMRRRGVDIAADEMNALMKLGAVAGKRLGYETFNAPPQIGRIPMEDE